MKKFVTLLALLLTACLTNPNPEKAEMFGTLELRFDSEGNARISQVLSDSSIAFDTNPSARGVYDDGTNRYVFVTYEFTNNRGSALNNLTLYAYNQAANNMGGTAIKNLSNFGNSSITAASAAQGLKPTHGMQVVSGTPSILATREDLQFFRSTEASDVQSAARPNTIGSNDTVLEYGFVARGLSAGVPGGRSIANNARGRVTLAYKFPSAALGNTSNPYSFVATFVMTNETTTRVSRSREESTTAASSRATAIAASEVMLVGADTDTTTGAVRLGNIRIGNTPTMLLGGSMRFYGNGRNDIDRVKIPLTASTPANIGTGDFTLEFWIKGNQSDNTFGNCVSGNNAANWINGTIAIDRDIAGNVSFGSFGISVGQGRLIWGLGNNQDSGYTICSSSVVLNGNWHHIALTRQASTGRMQIFVDGVLESTYAGSLGTQGNVSYNTSRSTSYPNSDPFLVLGAEKHGDYASFNGSLDELRLSSSIRYTSNFVVSRIPFSTDAQTAALYHFDEGSGLTLGDAMGSSPGNLRVGGTPQGPVWSGDTPL